MHLNMVILFAKQVGPAKARVYIDVQASPRGISEAICFKLRTKNVVLLGRPRFKVRLGTSRRVSSVDL